MSLKMKLLIMKMKGGKAKVEKLYGRIKTTDLHSIPELHSIAFDDWIPASIGNMPDTSRPVIVTWINTKPTPYYEHVKNVPFTGAAHYFDEKWYWYSSTTEDMLNEYGKCYTEAIDKDIKILAWKEFPEPYKGE